jgi:hypothetical protein
VPENLSGEFTAHLKFKLTGLEVKCPDAKFSVK